MRPRFVKYNFEEGNYPFGPGRTGWHRYLGPLLGLLWLTIPIVHTVREAPSAGHIALTALAVGAFAYVYLSRVARWTVGMRDPLRDVVGMVAIATLLTLTVDDAWSTLYVYSAVAAGLRMPPRVNGIAVLAVVGVAAGVLALGGADGGTILGIAGTTFGIGAIFTMIGAVTRANASLREARAELAELAVAEERLRFARDLHDLLGHDLSLIALKAELAGKLLPARVDEATTEVAEIKDLTRSALAQVREAVGGYRQPTLARELAGARMALEAAGIELEVEDPSASLDPAVESVLAWTVREGATNVIRHSGASHAAIAVRPGLARAEVEITDDGTAGRASNGAPLQPGHGLDGLRERASSIGGSVEVGAASNGGFRLRVSVPVRGVETAK